MNEKHDKNCLVCHRTDEEIPLVELSYKGGKLWICPQHIPVLIHNPQELVGKIQGAETFEAG